MQPSNMKNVSECHGLTLRLKNDGAASCVGSVAAGFSGESRVLMCGKRLANTVGLKINRGEHCGGDGIAHADQSQQQMLRADLRLLGANGLFTRGLQHTLGALAES